MSNAASFQKNPSLIPLEILIGKWNVTMKHVAIPNFLTWQDDFEWIDNSFILWHWAGKNEVPEAKIIIGANENNSSDKYTMLYYDSRGISRNQHMIFENGIWKFWRNGADFYQRFEGYFSCNNTIIKGKGDMSKDKGKTWQLDFDITYERIVSA
jgi:hypothetical protein